MPRNTRQWARRKLLAAVSTLDATGTHLHEISTIYRPVHPEIADPLDMMLQAIMEMQSTIEKVRVSI